MKTGGPGCRTLRSHDHKPMFYSALFQLSDLYHFDPFVSHLLHCSNESYCVFDEQRLIFTPQLLELNFNSVKEQFTILLHMFSIFQIPFIIPFKYSPPLSFWYFARLPFNLFCLSSLLRFHTSPNWLFLRTLKRAYHRFSLV